MAARRSCDIVIDTSIAWAMAVHPREPVQRALRRFLAALNEVHTVCYTEYTLFELRVTGFEGFRLRSILNSVAVLRVVGIDRARAYRFRRTRRLGVNDILIALAARELEAILATGDWPQASLYMDLTGRRPIYIPLQEL